MDVGEATTLGPEDVGATCVVAIDSATIFDYPPVPIEVTTVRHLQVSPGTTVTAGTTLTVSSVGPCPVGAGSSGGPTGGYWGQVELAPDLDGYGIAYGTSVEQNVSGREWSATILIPPDTTPGSYVLIGQCVIQRAVLASYNPLAITVTAG
jgi:hypothetical protein